MAHVMELEIGGETYQFKAGFAFIREVDPMHKQKQNGIEENIGLNVLIGGLYDKDTGDLLDALYAMNKGQSPRITKAKLEEYIEDCDDIEGLFDQVNDFLLNANCTKTKAKRLAKMYEKMMERQEAELTGRGRISTEDV